MPSPGSNNWKRFAGVLGGLVCALWPSSALADTGIPMLAVVWPGFWLALVPVVLVEALVARRVLALPPGDCLRLSLIANAWSTFVGIPLTWLALLILEMCFGFLVVSFKLELGRVGNIIATPLFAPWIGPEPRDWQIFAAAAFLCIPFMFVSVRIEAWSASRRVPRDQAMRWARFANFATYCPAILVLAGVALAKALTK